jgi:Mg2+ and Co2+ transporter CorA
VPSSEDITFVQKKEDDTNKAIMMLRANAGILESIATFYQELMHNADFPLRTDAECQRAVADFLVDLRDDISDFKLHVDRAQTLGKITADRKNLVQQHLQAHATAKMEAMTLQAQKDAATMKIITVVTLIYLPATFVSVSLVD